MFSLTGLFALVALGFGGWAAWFWFLAALYRQQLRASRLELVTARLSAADEQAAKETALQLLDALAQERAADLATLSAKLDALQHKYNVTRQLYQESIAIDGPLASRRVQ